MVLEFDEELLFFIEDKLNVVIAEARLNFFDKEIRFFEEQLNKILHFNPMMSLPLLDITSIKQPSSWVKQKRKKYLKQDKLTKYYPT